MHRRSGAVFVALTLLVSLGSACKSNDTPSSLSSFSVTTRPPEVRVLGQTVSAPDGAPPPTKIALAARAVGELVNVYAAPDAATAARVLRNPTLERMPLAFLAVDRQGEWLQVRVPERPNNVTGWVRVSDVETTPVENRIVISVGQRKLRVLDKNQQALYETAVAVGKPATPTPLGRYYVDIWLPNPGSPYGSFMLSISGFSEVLKSFLGGRGQIAMHGWSNPAVMGQAVSNGCIRMRNADITQVAALAPLGTPVEIIA